MTVVLLSGGMDSTVALYAAKQRYGDVMAISFGYQQRHRERELAAARAIAKLAGVKHKVYDVRIPWAPMAGNVLPGRNGLLITIAATHAACMPHDGIARVVVGCCKADAEGFFDCRPEYLAHLKGTLSLGLGCEVDLVSPLIDRTKAQTVAMASLLGAWDALALSWTCYLGGEKPCGECSACKLRAQGFAEYGAEDPWHA